MNKRRNEQLIILKLRAGDKDAYQELYNLYSDPIFKFIYFKVSDREQALDILQDVFVRFMEITDTERIVNIRAYLYRIARNLIIDHYKQSDKQKLVELDDTHELKSTFGKEATEARLDLDILIKATFRLKPLWREIILLKYIKGLDYDEIAIIVQKSKTYVRVNLHRAITELKKILKEF